MKNVTYFIFLLWILLDFTSCNLKKMSLNNPSNVIVNTNERVRIEFDILEKKDDIVRKWKYAPGTKHDMLATVKQINTSDTLVEVMKPVSVVYENFEIKNLLGESADSLIGWYDYHVSFNPETYELFTTILQPEESTMDTINFMKDFKFNTLDQPDTFLIRIKDIFIVSEMESNFYSNWDTLIIN